MYKTLCRTLPILCVALAVVLLGTVSVAQDVFQVNYFNNAQSGLPGAEVFIDNPGEAHYAPLCSMIYVFDKFQEMIECCGCYQSHNNLSVFEVDGDLTSNQLTSPPSTKGVIKIVSAALNYPYYPGCDPTGVFGTPVVPTPDLRAWSTHVQNAFPVSVGSGVLYNPVTESPFLDASLSTEELVNLEAQCYYIYVLGSGHGLCNCPCDPSDRLTKKSKK